MSRNQPEAKPEKENGAGRAAGSVMRPNYGAGYWPWLLATVTAAVAVLVLPAASRLSTVMV